MRSKFDIVHLIYKPRENSFAFHARQHIDVSVDLTTLATLSVHTNSLLIQPKVGLTFTRSPVFTFRVCVIFSAAQTRMAMATTWRWRQHGDDDNTRGWKSDVPDTNDAARQQQLLSF